MALFPCNVGSGGTAQSFTMANRHSGLAQYDVIHYDANADSFQIANPIYTTYTELPEVNLSMSQTSPFPITITFKKAGYYRLQTSRTGSPSWVYKTANSTENTTGSTDNFVLLFYYSDLKQH